MLQGDADETTALINSKNVPETSNDGSSSSDDEEEVGGKRMSLWSLVFLSYFCVCGGPYGLEVAVNAGYPALTFIGLAVIPWIWALPLAMMTAELSTAMPDNDGFILWIKTAFTPFFGFLAGFVSWINSIIDVALYPVLFMSYLKTIFPSEILNTPYYYYTIQFGTILIIMIINLVGVDVVGKFSVIFTILVMSPFIVFLLWGAIERKMEPKYWLELPPDWKTVQWSLFINTLVWGYGGYDDVGNIAEELENPQKQFPRAMIILIFLSIISYMSAFIGPVSLQNNYSVWVDGYFADVAKTLGGNGLRIFIIIGAIMSSLGQFNALLCVSAQELRALGKKDLLNIPILTWKHKRFRTPMLAIIINTVLCAIVSVLPFSSLVQIDNVLYAFVMILEYAALIRMRYSHKDMERPYRISKSIVPTLFLVTPAVLFCFYIIIATCISSWIQAVMFGGVLATGSITYFFLWLARRCSPSPKPVN